VVEVVENHNALAKRVERVMTWMQLACEVTARRNGESFATLEKWLGENDLFFLRRNNAAPPVLTPWQVRAPLVTRGRQ
jgi:hypothetical protein